MTAIDAWLTCLAAFVAAFRRPDKIQAIQDQVDTAIEESAEIWKTLGVSRIALKKAVELIDRGKAASIKKPGAPSLAFSSALLDILSSIRPKQTAFLTSPAISEAQVRVARAAMTIWKFDPTTVERKEAALDSLLHVIHNPGIRSILSRQIVTPQDKPLAEVKHLVKTWTGRDDIGLSVDEAKAIKIKDPERYKRYLALRKQANDTWKTFVRNYVREKGGSPQPLSQVVPALADAGITLHPFADLKPLRIGEDLKLYTNKNRMTKAFPPPGSKVVFNPNFKDELEAPNDWIFRFQVPNSKASGMSYAYTSSSRKIAKAKIFQKVSSAITNVPKKRPLWLKDLNSTQASKYVPAAMTELMYNEAMRIGGAGKTDGEATYGLSTLLVGHTRYLPNSRGWVLTYPGKKGVQQKHVIKPTTPELDRALRIIDRLVKGKSKKDRLWTINGQPVTAGDVNAYFKQHGLGITPHKMRHVRGTSLMQQLLDKAKVPNGTNQAGVEKLVKGLAVQVGALLGHVSGEKVTPATAIKSYIDPTVIGEFFSKRGLRIPQWVPDLTGRTQAIAAMLAR